MHQTPIALSHKLSFACKVVPAGCIFLRRLKDLRTSALQLHHSIPISCEAKLDLFWWLDFLTLSTRTTYNTGVSSFLQFSAQYHIIPCCQASSLTLQYFCINLAHSVSYKTIKVYLAGIRLAHLEHGHPDPTSAEFLHLVIRGIRHSQGDSTCQRLLITINLLQTLKCQLRNMDLSSVEKCLMWAAFTTAFYGFLRISGSQTQPQILRLFDGLTFNYQRIDTYGSRKLIHLEKVTLQQQAHPPGHAPIFQHGHTP